jgi:hypothetical protein
MLFQPAEPVVKPLWEAWTGVVKERYRITPRGGGKSCLDGAFAKGKWFVVACLNLWPILTA